VFHGDPFDVELLLSVGCGVDVQDEAGRTGLLCSIILVRHQKNWRMHHTNSCSISRQLVLQPRCDYTQGEHKQQIEIARKLIQYGARLDSSTGTLLHTAARCGRSIHAEMLLEAAAQRGGGEEACHAYASITTTNTGHATDPKHIILLKTPNPTQDQVLHAHVTSLTKNTFRMLERERYMSWCYFEDAEFKDILQEPVLCYSLHK